MYAGLVGSERGLVTFYPLADNSNVKVVKDFDENGFKKKILEHFELGNQGC